MTIFNNKPHLIFWLSVPLIILIGILSGTETMDVNIHDTYFVFTKYHLSILISALFGIIGFGYWIMKKANRKLSKWLNWIHIILTFGSLLIMLGIPFISFESKKSEFPLYDDVSIQNLILTLIFLTIIFGQLFYIINIIIGIFRKNKTSG